MRAGAFYLNNKYSFDYGILIQHRPNRVSGERRMNNVLISNQNGQYFHDQGVYDNTELTLDCVFLNDYDFDYINAVDEFFDTGSYVDFTPYYDEEFTYKVLTTSSPVFTHNVGMGRATTFKVTLTVAPMKFYNSGNRVIEFEKEVHLLNPSRYISKPVITLFGSGTLTLKVNDDDFIFNDAIDKVVVDSEKLTCVGAKMVGLDYPVIENDTIITTNAVKACIQPRFIRRAV